MPDHELRALSSYEAALELDQRAEKRKREWPVIVAKLKRFGIPLRIEEPVKIPEEFSLMTGDVSRVLAGSR